MIKEFSSAVLPEKNIDKQINKDDVAEKNIEAAKDPIREKIFSFLNQEGILSNKDNTIVFDDIKFQGREFLEKLRRLRFGNKNDKAMFGSKKLVYEKLADLDMVTIKDYQESLIKGEEAKLAKLFNKKDKDLAKERLLNILRENAILKNIDGYNVFDLDKFLYSDFMSNKLINTFAETRNKTARRFNQKIIFEKLSDLKVISKEDYEQQKGGELSEIKLFNIPESVDEAYNVEDYKNKSHDYYLNYWDLHDHTKRKQTGWDNQIELENGEKVNVRELALAIGVFRDFDGERDEEGNLLVYDKEKGKHIKINSEWVIKNIGSLGGNVEGSSMAYPHQFLLNHCPNLLNKGIIKLKDFNIVSNTQSGELIRKEFTVSGNNPYVMINGVRYFIGKDFFYYSDEKIPTKNLKIIILDDKTAGVFKTTESKDNLMFTFKLLSDNEKEQKRGKVKEASPKELKPKEISARTFVNKKEIDNRISPWQVKEDNPQKNNESPKEYAERIAHVGDWEFIKKVSDDFTKEHQIGIHNLSWREQQWLARAAYELGGDYERLLEFGKKEKYGLVGLKTFLSCEQDIKNGRKILEIGEKLNKEDALKIFEKYGEISQIAENISDELTGYFQDINISEKERQKISDSLLGKAKDTLVHFADKIESGEKMSSNDIMVELGKVNANILFTKKIIEQLPREEVAKLNLKKIPHIEKLENISGKDLLQNPEFKENKLLEKMQNIIKAQFPEGDDKVFEEECENKNLEITVTLAGGEVLSFFAKERKENGVVYLDWYLSNPEPAIKGLGEATLKLGLDSENEKKENYYAVAKPHAKSFSILVEKQGFVGFDGQTLDNEYIDYYARVRRLPSDSQFLSKKLTKDEEVEFKKIIMEAVGDVSELDNEENKLKEIKFKEKIFRVAKVEYHGQTHKENISKDEPDGWIMAEMEKQNKKGFILTRFIPMSKEKDNQTFYAVFEKDNAPEEAKEKIREVINDRLKENGLLRGKQEAPTRTQKKRAEAA